MATTTPQIQTAGEMAVQPGRVYRAAANSVVYRQRFVHSEAHLQFLSCGEHHLPGDSISEALTVPGCELLLYMWKGRARAEVDGVEYDMAPYDTLYVPLGSVFRLRNPHPEPACLIQTSAPALHSHPAFHSSFAEFSQREDRIRHLKGKDVYMMFDVSEPADKLVAGYTFFQPFQRSWPPHNHTDQEEVYFFIQGRGAMEVYDAPETTSFVRSVEEGDLVTIPMLNFHPVFSQEDPLRFIWCIAGERYWVGDKNKSFLSGQGTSLTT
ncbi:MAG: 5-deoxy-glucuronate isomerase [Acidobacteria bacterium]|nr:5-deoxy-glucuronate isomerase [Acidobacteriota bacterium]